MIITYHGIECFRAQFGDTNIVFNPISKKSSFKPARIGGDIVLSTTNQAEFNGFESAQNGGNPFFISGPGEYEVKEVIIKGFLSSSNYGGGELTNKN